MRLVLRIATVLAALVIIVIVGALAWLIYPGQPSAARREPPRGRRRRQNAVTRASRVAFW